MDKQNSIIGCGYIPRNVQAVCLKTKNNATLGEAEYKIISEVYERKFELSGLCAAIAGKKAVAHAAIKVLDTKTGLTYAVEYEPANLVRNPVEYSWEDIKMHLPKGMRIVPINEVPEKNRLSTAPSRSPRSSPEFLVPGGGFRKSAVLCFLRFQTTATVKRTRVRHSSEDAEIAFAKASPQRVQKIAKFCKYPKKCIRTRNKFLNNLQRNKKWLNLCLKNMRLIR